MEAKAKNSKLFEAVRLRLQGHSARQIAEKLGCSEGHVHKLFIDPRFKEELARRQEDLTAATLAVLTAGAQQAAARMVKLTQSANDAVALRACDLVLSHGRQGREEFTLADRLDALESLLHMMQADGAPSGPNIRIVDWRDNPNASDESA